jgi:hypothetical protein
MLGSKSDSMGSGGGGARPSAPAGDMDHESHAPMEHEPSGPEVTDEDIPF